MNDFSTQSADPKRAKLQRFNELLKQVKELEPGDVDGFEAIIKAAVDARLGDTHIEMLVTANSKAAKVKIARGFAAKAQVELRKHDEAEPDAREERERHAAAMAEAARREKEAEIARLFTCCRAIAESPTLLADMESIVHRMGVIGEGVSVRSAYLSATSRLLRESAIPYLRRGASSSGKNVLLDMVYKLLPRDDVIRITTASPLSLIFFGDSADALKHKILFIGEAAAIARKSSGDESPITILVRQLLSEKQINHPITLKQKDGSFQAANIQRNGPVVVWLTSARDNIEDELMTRLQTADSDESADQTLRVARLSERRKRSAAADGLERWLALQEWLRATMPPGGYEVEIPFDAAFDAALEDRIKRGATPAQLRWRRDVPSIGAAIEASAVLHKAQREINDDGRIVATLADYQNAYYAFEPGIAALYDIKPPEALETALAKIVEIAAEQAESTDRDKLHAVSHKISAEQLRRHLGVNSTSTAWDRLYKLSALGAIEEDEGKRGRGRGSPRFYYVKQQSLAGLTGGVYPTVEAVESRFSFPVSYPTGEGGEREQKSEETLGSSHSIDPFSERGVIERELPSESSGFRSHSPSEPEGKGKEIENCDFDAPLAVDGVEIALAETYSEAEALIKEMVADAEGASHSVALDIETAPSPAEQARLKALLEEEEAVSARRKEARAAAKKAGGDIEAAVAPFEAELKILAKKIEYAEAAGLDPRRAAIRLLQLYGGGARCAVIDIAKAGAAVLEPLRGSSAVIHNATFELGHLGCAGIELGRVNDTMQATRMTLGRAKCSLAAAVAHYCRHKLDKDEQAGDWSVPTLTEAQIRYAARDVVWLWRLAERVFPDLGPQAGAYRIQAAALHAIGRLSARGVTLDCGAHAAALRALADQGAEAGTAYRDAAEAIGRPDLAATIPENDRETAEALKAVLTETELIQWPRVRKPWELSTAKSELRKAADKPLVAALVSLAEARLARSQWGETLPLLVSPATGRLHPNYHAAGAPTGRTTCSGPNIQGAPRDKRFRSMFKAAAGFVLVAADYGSMDLRTAAYFFEEPRLQGIFASGGDLHALTAARMLGAAAYQALVEPERSEARSKAKTLNFGSLYGIMARSLVEYAWKNFGVRMTMVEAERFLDAFAEMFPDLVLHRREYAQRCAIERRIVIGANWRDGRGRIIPFDRLEGDQNPTTCSFAYPIQGINADISAAALTAIDQKLREHAIDGGPVIWSHDEIVLEAREADAEFAGTLLKGAMEAAFLGVFPGATMVGLVSVHAGANWAEAK